MSSFWRIWVSNAAATLWRAVSVQPECWRYLQSSVLEPFSPPLVSFFLLSAGIAWVGGIIFHLLAVGKFARRWQGKMWFTALPQGRAIWQCLSTQKNKIKAKIRYFARARRCFFFATSKKYGKIHFLTLSVVVARSYIYINISFL